MARDTRLFARIDLDYADHPKIAGLSDGAFRAHIEMILYARKYLTDGRIPKRVANRFGSDSLTELTTNDEATPSLRELPDGSYLLHGFTDMQETKAEVEKKRQINRENGRRGGRPPKTQSVSESPSESKAETETETETVIDTVQPAVGPRSPYSEAFESWWKHYPRRESKGDAFKAWEQARKAHTLPAVDELIAAAESYAKREQRPEFRKLPGGWLRDRKWEDESSPASRHDPDWALKL